MRRCYYCPYCNKMLNPGPMVVLIIEHRQDRDLVLLSSELGDYAIIYPATFPLKLGSLYTFRCPLCSTDLTSVIDHRLVDLVSTCPDGSKERVSFSRVYGERATFVFGDDRVDRFGEHADEYEVPNYFGEIREPK